MAKSTRRTGDRIMPVTEQVNQLTLPVQLIQRALPVSTAAALLKSLVDSWLQASCARAACISMVCGHDLVSVFADADRLPELQIATNHLSEPSRVWSAALASDTLASLPDDGSGPPTSMMVVPFELDGVAVGGALLPGSLVSTSAFAVLADVSARLIGQLRDSVGAETRNVTLSETRLRDLKLEAMAEFAAGAGHEINNPVATIAGRSSLLLKTESDPERRRILETIGGQAYRIRDMIGDAMTFARAPEPVFEEFEPSREIQRIAEELMRQFSDKHVTLETSLADSIKLQADREQFRVVVSCLVRNSLESTSEGGIVRVELNRHSTGADSGLPNSDEGTWFVVSDDGTGLSEAEREHLFDPFYSGRQAGRGLGFGLSKCWQILRIHGGSIHVADSFRNDSDCGLKIVTVWPDDPHSQPRSLPGVDL